MTNCIFKIFAINLLLHIPHWQDKLFHIAVVVNSSDTYNAVQDPGLSHMSCPRVERISLICFLAGCGNGRLNQALSVLGFFWECFVAWYSLLVLKVPVNIKHQPINRWYLLKYVYNFEKNLISGSNIMLCNFVSAICWCVCLATSHIQLESQWREDSLGTVCCLSGWVWPSCAPPVHFTSTKVCHTSR